MFDQLPFHPTTGLQALGFTKRNCPIWPVMGGAPDDGDAGGNEGEGGDQGGDQSAGLGDQNGGGGGDLGFPANTPIKDMNAEQQAAYWKHHDRRKSDTLKSYGGITPEQAKQYKDAAEAAARSQMSPADQALADARTEGRTAALQEAASQWAPEFANQVIGQFVPDEAQRASVLAGINPMNFVKDGKFDTDALVGHLKGLATAFGGSAGGDGQEQQPRQWGQSGDRPPAQTASAAGLAEAERRGYVKK